MDEDYHSFKQTETFCSSVAVEHVVIPRKTIPLFTLVIAPTHIQPVLIV